LTLTAGKHIHEIHIDKDLFQSMHLFQRVEPNALAGIENPNAKK